MSTEDAVLRGFARKLEAESKRQEHARFVNRGFNTRPVRKSGRKIGKKNDQTAAILAAVKAYLKLGKKPHVIAGKLNREFGTHYKPNGRGVEQMIRRNFPTLLGKNL